MIDSNFNQRSAWYRILDANANRAGEGLRTLEETARFSLSAVALCSELKRLRHDLASALKRLPRIDLLRARDTPSDVGTSITTSSEQQRLGEAEIIAAASSRVAQSLRCLEEYGKAIDVEFAATVETIRYRAYDVCSRLEQTCIAGNHRLHRIQSAHLYALIDAGIDQESFVNNIRRLTELGVDVVQLRDPGIDDRTLFTRASIGTAVAKEVDVLFIVNDRPDVAMLSGADGVHVGQEELPVDQVRRIIGPTALIGLSTHDIDQVRNAVASSADYIGCGPVFAGRTKTFSYFPGCDFLQQVSDEQIELPAFAIGGIRQDNIAHVVATGFHRVAVTAAAADDAPEGEIQSMLKHLKHCGVVR